MTLYQIFILTTLLITMHFIGDYVLQSDFMAKAKNRNTDVGRVMSTYVLPAHASVHGLLVLIVTGSIILFYIEAIFHYIVDYNKNESIITLHQDQLLHLGSKIVVLVPFTMYISSGNGLWWFSIIY